MSARFFLDTNVLIYSLDRENAGKRRVAQELVTQALEESKGVISYQVVQEFLSVAFRKFQTRMKPEDAERYLQGVLEPLCAVFAGIPLYHQALDIARRWKYGFYDALIIASALEAGCSILYSEDLQNGQKIGKLKIVNPFLEGGATPL